MSDAMFALLLSSVTVFDTGWIALPGLQSWSYWGLNYLQGRD